jgi:hypothetical protein
MDMGRLSALASRPGIDPRVWITLAVVKEVGFDADEGIFADVQFMPTGEIETAFLAGDYAGDGFGSFAPVMVDDWVLVAVPGGDPNMGPVIISRFWRASDKPHQDFKAEEQEDGHDVPTENVVLRVRPGKKYILRTSDTDGDIMVQAEGDGKILVEGKGNQDIKVKQTGTGNIFITVTDGHLVHIGDEEGTQFQFLAEDERAWLEGFRAEFNKLRSDVNTIKTHTHLTSCSAGGAMVPASTDLLMLPTASTVDESPALSEKVKNS